MSIHGLMLAWARIGQSSRTRQTSLLLYFSPTCGAGAIPEVSQNWTIWPMIPAAFIGELLQGFHHGLHLADFPLQPGDLLLCQTLHIATLAGSVSPERQQFLDFLHRKAKVARAPDEAQHLHFGVRIDAVADTPEAFAASPMFMIWLLQA
jgi:hypothetical protein